MRLLFTLLSLLFSSATFGQALLKTNILYPTLVRGASLALEVPTANQSSLSVYAAFGANGDLVLADAYRF